MTSSIFLPRMSRAWPEPSTHLMESTMFVLPEPLGPTIAVTPPSNWISVCRAKFLKPSNCRDLRNKLAPRVADVGVVGPLGHYLIDRLAELPASWLGKHRLGCALRRSVQRHDLGGRNLRWRCSLIALLARCPAGPWTGRRRLARRRLGHRSDQTLERRPSSVLLRLLLVRAMA